MSKNNQVKEFYAQDVVYKFDQHNNNKIIFGVVLDSYDCFDNDDNQRLKKGQIIVLWYKRQRKQLCKQYKVDLISRNVIPGDIVRRLVDGKETQRGYCKFTEQWLTVRILGTNKIIENVPDSRLCFFKKFEIGDAICLGDKFGRIINIDHIIKMQSKCGSIVEINTSINIDIRDLWDNNLKFGPDYPGQAVTCVPSLLKDPRWLKKTKMMNRRMSSIQTFRIQTITPYIIEVWWYNPNGHTEYAELQEDDIKKLKVLPSTDFILWGNRLVMQLQQNDVLLKYKNWLKKMSMLYQPDQVPNNQSTINENYNHDNNDTNDNDNDDNDDDDVDDEEKWDLIDDDDINSEDNKLIKRMNKVKITKLLSKKPQYKPKCTPGSLVAVEVISIDSKSTIVWQDGTQEKNIPTKELYFSVSLDDHEFFPGEWVVLNTNTNDDVYGVVQLVNFAERTAEIKWFVYSKELEKPQQINNTEQISVYELKKHPTFIFRPGSVVCHRKPNIQSDLMGKVVDSCIDGYVKVQWMNGPIEHCWPQNIQVLPDNEMFDYNDDDDDDEYDDDDDRNNDSIDILNITKTEGDHHRVNNDNNSNSSSDDDRDSVNDKDDALSWTTESTESFNGDVTDDIILENMATKVIFIKERLSNLREILRNFTINKNFNTVKDLLLIYDNSSYLDKYLGTSFFSLQSKHFQLLLAETKKRAKSLGIELRGHLFTNDTNPSGISKLRNPEIDNIQKIIKLQNKINQQIENSCESVQTPDSVKSFEKTEDDLCIELILMLLMRFDLVYAEIVSRMSSRDGLTVLKNTTERSLSTTTSQQQFLKQLPSSNTLQKLNNPTTTTTTTTTLINEIGKKPLLQRQNTEFDGFLIVEEAPIQHHYYNSKFHPKDLQKFLNILKKEYRLLKESLPSGICIKAYTDRIDLLSLLIIGPAKTPYEDGIFLFDIQLKSDYPTSPPSVHYISYIQEQLNPNLYVEGKVCVSLLGTWIGRGSEVWGTNSTLLQLIVSIQGLILVAEPYYNEAGYEKQLNTQQGCENSRTYNEFVLLKLIQSMTELLKNPPKIYEMEIYKHFEMNGIKMYERLYSYLNVDQPTIPEFPLQPVSRGLQYSLKTALENFKEVLKKTIKN